MSTELDTAACWAAVLDHLRTRVPAVSFDTWFAHTTLEALDDGEAVIGVASLFIKEWLRDRYLDTIAEAFVATTGTRPAIAFRTVGAAYRSLHAAKEGAGPAPAAAGDAVGPDARPAPADTPAGAAARPKRPVLHLADFVAGADNRVVAAACERVADLRPDFSQLVLHGESGTGKTHLLLGLEGELRARHPDLDVRYLTCEQFLAEFLRAVEENRRDAFRQRYARADVLLLDDAQGLGRGKRERTQEEFLLIFDELQRRGRHVVLALDAPPAAIEGMTPRLARRLGAGLVLEVHAPDAETRQAIVAAKLRTRGLALPDEVIRAVADRSRGCVRSIEGAVARLAAFAEIAGDDLTPEAVRNLLGPAPADALDAPAPMLDEVIDAVAEAFRVGRTELCGRKRSGPVRTARTAAMVLGRELTGASYQEIGAALGGRKHATVISAIRNARGLFSGDAQAAQRFRRLRERFPVPRQSRLFDLPSTDPDDA
ncbi:MAG: DnaA ATPase domain-containing protein [Planctomycetota bacterium]